MQKHISTVTLGKWSVSYMSSSETPGVILNVFIPRNNYRLWQYGDHNKKWFATRDEATKFALERGYVQPYYPKRFKA